MVQVKVTNKVPYYNERFPKGSKARVADLTRLEEFMKTWRLHHKLQPEQLEYAGRVAVVTHVGFYHGGDPIYTLSEIPGLWLDQCLVEPESK
jgi:hypothetical protein